MEGTNYFRVKLGFLIRKKSTHFFHLTFHIFGGGSQQKSKYSPLDISISIVFCSRIFGSIFHIHDVVNVNCPITNYLQK